MKRSAMGTGLRGVRALTVALVVAAPAAAFAHARMMTPTPRSNADGNKNGPCGAVVKAATPAATYNAGAQVPVTFMETIDHSGCYDIVFSNQNADPQNGAGWQRLMRMDDPAGNPNSTHNVMVKLPDGVTCDNCTLALRQVMQNSTGGKCPGGNCVCDPGDPDDMDGGAPTYFSCADIRIVPVGVDAGPPPTSSSSSGGSTSSGNPADPTDPDGDPNTPREPGGNLRAGQGDACSVGWGTTTGVTAFAGLGIALAALARRRRKS